MRTRSNNVYHHDDVTVIAQVVTLDDEEDKDDGDISVVEVEQPHSETLPRGCPNPDPRLKEDGDGLLVRQYHPEPNFAISQCDGSRYCIQSKAKVPKDSPWQVLHCPSKYISRHHCEIYRKDGAYWIKDLGSVNGTYVNGSQLEEGKEVRLKFGDMIYISTEYSKAQGFFNVDWDQCYIFLFEKASTDQTICVAGAQAQDPGSRQPEPSYDLLDSDDSDVEIISETWVVTL